MAYAWRAFALQRYSTSASGLDFIHIERSEKIPEEAPEGLDYHTVHPYMVSAIRSRGPGLRYGATGAVWGEGRFTVLTPQIQVWGPEHPGIEFELRHKPDGTWRDVYCGVMWESPNMFRKGFTAHGYRLMVPAPGSGMAELVAEQWKARKCEWRPLRNGGAVVPDPLKTAAETASSFTNQLKDRHPSYDWLEDLRRTFGR